MIPIPNIDEKMEKKRTTKTLRFKRVQPFAMREFWRKTHVVFEERPF